MTTYFGDISMFAQKSKKQSHSDWQEWGKQSV